MNILITGGASGLGEVITKSLSSIPGSTVYFTYCSSLKNAEKISKEHPNCKHIKYDFENKQDIQLLTQQFSELNIDVLINNAFSGPIHKNYFHKIPDSVFSEGFNKNILPTIQITQSAITHFRKKKQGKIITVLSSAIINRPPIGWSEYVAAKSYLQSLSKSWAIENANFNITSNCISPSFMQTKLTSDTDERVVEEMINSHPLKKLLTPEEVAETIKFMTTASSHINGTNIIMNSAGNVI